MPDSFFLETGKQRETPVRCHDSGDGFTRTEPRPQGSVQAVTTGFQASVSLRARLRKPVIEV